MALKDCSKLARIVNRVLLHRTVTSSVYTRKLSYFPLRTQHALYPATSASHKSDLLRSCSSVAQENFIVSHDQLKRLLSACSGVVIDVREPWELREYGSIPGSINVPLGQVNQALQLSSEEFRERYGSDMPSTRDHIVFSCLAGVRSKKALDAALSLGYSNVKHYPGGWEEWAKREVMQVKH